MKVPPYNGSDPASPLQVLLPFISIMRYSGRPVLWVPDVQKKATCIEFCPGYPDVWVADVTGISCPKTLSLGSFFLPSVLLDFSDMCDTVMQMQANPIDKQVLWLEVTVQYPPLVAEGHSTKKLHADPCSHNMRIKVVGDKRNAVSRVVFRRRELTEPHWVLGQTRWVLRKTRWVCFVISKIGWEELTELSLSETVFGPCPKFDPHPQPQNSLLRISVCNQVSTCNSY